MYPTIMSQEIARKVIEIRKRLGLKQTEIAALAGTSRSYVTHLEKGEMMPSLEFAFKLEKALKLSNGEISDLVIQTARIKAGAGSNKSEAIHSQPHQPPAASAPGLECVALRQNCPSCGNAVSLRVSFS